MVDCKKCKKLLMCDPHDGSGYLPYPVRLYRCAEIMRDITDLEGECSHFEER